MFMFRRSPCRPKLADEAEEHNEMKVSERSPNQAQFLSEDVLGRARTWKLSLSYGTPNIGEIRKVSKEWSERCVPAPSRRGADTLST
jgi:hypothetical protein